MKRPSNLLKLVLAAVMLLVAASSVYAQTCVCPEGSVAADNKTAAELRYITDSDYPYFLNIKKLNRYSNIVYEGLPSNSTGIRSYRLTSYNKHQILDASYRKDGSLINGRLIKKDVLLPRPIRIYLLNNGFKDWTMVRNKTVVHDFDAKRTEYEVKMQRGDEKQTLFFNHQGKPIKNLSRT